jgi:hypothetical protein
MVMVCRGTRERSTGPQKAAQEALSDRIGDSHEHDRQGAAGMLQRGHALGAARQDGIRFERDQFRRVSAIAVDIILAPPCIDPQTATVAPAQLL